MRLFQSMCRASGSITVFVRLAVALGSFLLSGCSGFKEIDTHTTHGGWVTIEASDDGAPFEILARKLSDSPLFEYQIKSELGLSASACQAALRRGIRLLAAGLDGDEYPVYQIVYESVDSLLTYVIHDEPFPFKNTEMVVRYDYYLHEDGQMGVTWKEAWDEYDVRPSSKLSRVETFRGSWNFAPVTDHTTNAIHTVQFDPKGMPRWLAEPMLIKFMKDSFEKVLAHQ
ncbi:MAG: hypothetical protein AAGA85_19125 [Bacteroidota bacterium]